MDGEKLGLKSKHQKPHYTQTDRSPAWKPGKREAETTQKQFPIIWCEPPRRTDWKSARVFTIPVAGASLRFLQLLANKISKAPRQRGRGVIFSLDEHDTASQGLPSKAHGYEPADLDLIGH